MFVIVLTELPVCSTFKYVARVSESVRPQVVGLCDPETRVTGTGAARVAAWVCMLVARVRAVTPTTRFKRLLDGLMSKRVLEPN